MYAVLGATGRVGGAAARDLLAQGRQVRVIVRDEAKSAGWTRLGAEAAVADLGDTEALKAAFAGAEGIFVMIPPVFYPASADFPETQAVLAALLPALESVPEAKIAALSSVGGHLESGLGIIGQSHMLEEALRRLRNPVALIRAAWFMENAQWDIPQARSEGRIEHCLYPLDRPIPMVSTADIGSAAAALLQESWQGLRVIELEGPQPYSPEDIASTLGDLLIQPVQASSIPREEWEAAFIRQGAVPGTSGGRIEMLEGFNSGWIDFERRGTERRTGERTLKEALARLI